MAQSQGFEKLLKEILALKKEPGAQLRLIGEEIKKREALLQR